MRLLQPSQRALLLIYGSTTEASTHWWSIYSKVCSPLCLVFLIQCLFAQNVRSPSVLFTKIHLGWKCRIVMKFFSGASFPQAEYLCIDFVPFIYFFPDLHEKANPFEYGWTTVRTIFALMKAASCDGTPSRWEDKKRFWANVVSEAGVY